jgi:hypothetical protein
MARTKQTQRIIRPTREEVEEAYIAAKSSSTQQVSGGKQVQTGIGKLRVGGGKQPDMFTPQSSHHSDDGSDVDPDVDSDVDSDAGSDVDPDVDSDVDSDAGSDVGSDVGSSRPTTGGKEPGMFDSPSYHSEGSEIGSQSGSNFDSHDESEIGAEQSHSGSDSESEDPPEKSEVEQLQEEQTRMAQEVHDMMDWLLQTTAQQHRLILGTMADSGDYPFQIQKELVDALKRGKNNTAAGEKIRQRIIKALESAHYKKRRRAKNEKTDYVFYKNTIFEEAPEFVYEIVYYNQAGKPKTPVLKGIKGELNGSTFVFNTLYIELVHKPTEERRQRMRNIQADKRLKRQLEEHTRQIEEIDKRQKTEPAHDDWDDWAESLSDDEDKYSLGGF